MNWIDDAIAGFGRSIGIPGLALDEEGRLHLGLSNGGLIHILQTAGTPEPAVLVCRSRPLEFDAPRQVRAALRLTDYRLFNAWPLQAAREEDELVLALRIPQRAFTAVTLEQAIMELARLQTATEDVFAGGARR